MRNHRNHRGHSGFGRTSAYDYDEWVRQHYPKNPYYEKDAYGSQKTSSYGPQNSNNSKSKQKESSYWNEFETEEIREVMKNRKKRFYALFVFVLILHIISYQATLMERKRQDYRIKKYQEPKNGSD